MKTIYATSFDNDTKEIHGYSVDSNMKSFNEVINLIGDNTIKKTSKMIIYPGIVFSDFPFKLEASKNET